MPNGLVPSLVSRGMTKVKSEVARLTMGSPREWPAGRRVVSFTFDDFPCSAASAGADILEACGYRGTFYASFGLAGQESPSGNIASEADVRSLAFRGHEIGCHTFGHINCALEGPERVDSECRKNRLAAIEAGIGTLQSFSYPFGALNRGVRRTTQCAFTSARSTWIGINRARFDIAALRAVPVMKRDGLALCMHALRSLSERDGWLVFYTHDVEAAPSIWGCEPSELKALCEAVRDAGFDVDTVGQVAETVKSLAPRVSRVSEPGSGG